MKILNNKGFSLIELVVAIALITITGTTLFYGFVASGRTNAKNIKLQRAEDVAQYVAEEFNSYSLASLKTKYSTQCVVTTDDGTASGKVTEVNFTNVPYSYSAVPGETYYANIKLTPTTFAGESTSNNTTYKQNLDDTAAIPYSVKSDVGTNTFIVPEVINVLDGSHVVVGEELNQCDNRVVSDLYTALKKQVDMFNDSKLPADKLDASAFDSGFSAKYIPLSNATGSNDVVKKTDITIHANTSGTNEEYYYIVTLTYTFSFDMNIPFVDAVKHPTPVALSSLVTSGVDIAEKDTAEIVCTIKRSGTKYVVVYSGKLPADKTGYTATSGKSVGTFAGVINVQDKKTADPTVYTYREYGKDNSGDEVAYLYFLYTPFDKFTSGLTANDEIEFHLDGTPTNTMRVYFIVQNVKHLTASGDVKIDNCKSPGSTATFKLYTNSSDIIDRTLNNFTAKDYVTNSGKSRMNMYKMEIEIIKDGQTVATYNTVKED